jgi:hypothetical protein
MDSDLKSTVVNRWRKKTEDMSELALGLKEALIKL